MWRKVRATTLAVASVTLVCSAAFAADPIAPPEVGPVVVAPAAPAPVSQGNNWSGAYVGLVGGYAWGTWDGTHVYLEDPDNLGTWDDPTHSIPVSGWLAGLTVGVNHQRNALVFGLEGDFSWAWITWDTYKETSGGGYIWETMHTLDNIMTARARLGIAVGAQQQVLLYGTAGFATARVHSEIMPFDNSPPGPTQTAHGTSTNTHVGFAGGVGAEIALGQAFSVKLEWLHLGFGEEPYHYIGETLSPPFAVSGPYFTDATPSTLSLNVLRLGVNVRF
jgi:outer membrane immunogenic protein